MTVMSKSIQRVLLVLHAVRGNSVLVPLVLLLAAGGYLRAQQPQIPTLQVCNQPGSVKGEGKVLITPRADVAHSGTFAITIGAGCNTTTGYPDGGFTISGLSMSDSVIQGSFKSTTVDQITVTGKHTPTVWLTGRCVVAESSAETAGCKYWLMIADNHGKPEDPKTTPTIISFLVFNKAGKRIAYGTGPLVSGSITVSPSGF